MEHLDGRVGAFAASAYIVLPLFLALVAGVCLLVATMRKTLTGAMAAALAALAAVVVVAAAVFFYPMAHPAPPTPMAPPPAIGQLQPPTAFGASDDGAIQKDLAGEVVKLSAENRKLRNLLQRRRDGEAAGDGAPAAAAEAKAADAAKPGDATKHAGSAVPHAPGKLPSVRTPLHLGRPTATPGAAAAPQPPAASDAAAPAPTTPPATEAAPPPTDAPKTDAPKQDEMPKPDDAPKPPAGEDPNAPK